MKFRRLTALVLVLMGLTAGLPAASALSDISGNPLEKDIRAAVGEGLIDGYGDGTFRPDGTVTRAEFAAMLNRALGLTGARSAGAGFADVRETDWYYGDVQCAAAQGYMRGDPDGRFRPDDPVTRYEAAVMLARLDAESDRAGTAESGVPEWARDGVRYAVAGGLFSGFVQGPFEGDRALTRAETASVLLCFAQRQKAAPAFFLLADDSDLWLYKNEYACFRFVLAGKGVAASVPERTEDNGAAFYGAVKKLAEPSVSGLQNMSVVSLEADGHPSYEAEKVSDDLLVYTVYAGTADSVPARFTVSLSMPSGSALAGFSLKNSALTVEIAKLGAAASAAPNVTTVRRLVNGTVRRIALWDADRHAQRYEAELFLSDADGNAVEGSAVVCRESVTVADGQAELDFTKEMEKLKTRLSASAAGAGMYICMRISAYPADGEAYLFYPVDLRFTASDSVLLLAGGKQSDSSAARMKRADGLTLELKLVDKSALLSQLPPDASGYRCRLALSVYDEAGSPVDGLFTLEQSSGALTLDQALDLTSAVRRAAPGDSLMQAVLRAADGAPDGNYSLNAVLRLVSADGTKEYGRVILTGVLTLS